ncbi:hypothetical protein HGRIS_002258 [Hohenbuehelia grisea]|uniref:GPI mannosyltransferase 2 n=1 Tax=Hohenbuehelia grisea TaxID=104357 RepID=A0ABR3JJY5_9AGAR
MPLSSLLLQAVAVHAATALFLYFAATYTPLFDAAPSLYASSSPLLRWDAFHFDHVARDGYRYEHDWAFLPGMPFVLRALAPLANMLGVSSLTLHAIVIFPLSLLSTHDLYQLSIVHLGSKSMARLATTISLLPASPVTLRLAPYAEPWFTAAAYRGMLLATRERWLGAACCFAIAASFRSNGILLAGFILWGMLVEPFMRTRKMPIKKLVHATGLTALVFAPFVQHNLSAYALFCSSDSGQADRPIWCDRLIPSVYTHVQGKYWDSGPFRYWTLSQLPNFALAAPVLVLLYAWSIAHLRHVAPHYWRVASINTTTKNQRRLPGTPINPPIDPFLQPSLTPHAIHAFVTASTLLFSANTQIALRLAAALPAVYWAAAWLYWRTSEREEVKMVRDVRSDARETSQPKSRWQSSKCYITWSMVWGALSIVLWAGFLPPA